MKILIRIACYSAEIDKNLNFLGHIPMYNKKLPQKFGICRKMLPHGTIGEKSRKQT